MSLPQKEHSKVIGNRAIFKVCSVADNNYFVSLHKRGGICFVTKRWLRSRRERNLVTERVMTEEVDKR